jgi:acyl-CoA synthetase (AMP-forming)/AMP-acid ligase II/peptidoglycan/LPS O-acetylase OafA/YrhL
MTTIPASWSRRPPAPTAEPFLLGGSPGDVALVAADETLTHAELADRVRDCAAELGTTRRLVLLEAANDVRTVVTYLAALSGRHPVLVVAADDADRQGDIVRSYAPDTVCTPDGIRRLHPGDVPRHELHPDLAVLLSTSGSTGSPKLVRLSRTNIEANARSIAAYLDLRPTDRAMTSLPLHYCYGLSVLTSHLVSGASIVLTDLSVADECFWDLARSTRATNFAGVPYTFDLLDASDFAARDLPHLRHVTQAGGRMAPGQVTRYAELGRRRGWDLFVMYGQTEATARIAYLPPALAAERPTSIGIPVPGGELRIDPLVGADGAAEPDVGELVYTGPNVMMGYAERAADLSRGHETPELRTGDLARQCDDGLFEITGRLNRCAKVFGLRVDLDRLERQLHEAGRPARLVAHDETLHAFVTQPRLLRRVREHVARLASVPLGAVRVYQVGSIPRTDAGKCDYAALSRHATAAVTTADDASPTSVRDLYAVALGRTDVAGSDSFTSLGGDSLSFVEVSTRLARHLGHLPRDWPHLTIDELTRAPRRRRRFTTPVEIGVLLRAVAIVMVVVTHTDILMIPGGAHVLLAVAGFNLARFALRADGRRARTRRILGALAAVVVPASAWIAGCALLTGDYRVSTAFYVNGLVGSDSWSPDWQFWFLEALVWSYLAVAALLALRRADGWQRAHPFATAMVVVGAALLVRYLLVGVEAQGTEKYSVAVVLWVLALGWAAAEARTHRQRVVVCVAAILGLLGFFGDLQRELVVAGGVALLLWSRPVALPAVVARLVQVVASASLWIYLTHWQVYPGLEAAGHAPAAILASVVVGVACSAAYASAAARLTRRRGRRTGPRSASRPRPGATPRSVPRPRARA